MKESTITPEGEWHNGILYNPSISGWLHRQSILEAQKNRGMTDLDHVYLNWCHRRQAAVTIAVLRLENQSLKLLVKEMIDSALSGYDGMFIKKHLKVSDVQE